ncbi:PQQ-dependent sugar dehydrogenase [Spirosoma sordidisoli]|uniref:DUF11 domain-containing protein n=1 Tax=Spirosoma sordidisoli TaxID=2502893 RepID=A0A4Q2UHR5_9BACT|nr:PQQ-dependent sugar dehydrogenase [Spirosoma sordidisoli]RYC68062.1 DUF11 domain-containing protein [Spirosoma sordidisoli]
MARGIGIKGGACWLFVLAIVASQNLAVAQPRSLHPHVTVDTYMFLSRAGVRLVQDPVSRTLFYADTEGNVFQLRPTPTGGLPEEVPVAGVAQHGIDYLQGLAFADSTLILVGIRRFPYEGVGRVAKGRLKADGSRQWSTLLETAPYANSNTAFDHAFNGVCVSPDQDSVYIASGSRTDHGEVQDAGGRFPNLRETALTARIFRLPLAAENLFLPNNDEAVRQSGLLFCEGVRNTFDMAFNSEGRLFGAENAGNRSDPEELNWLRPGRHYGFPWLIGGNETPQQFPDYNPDADPLLSAGYRTEGFRTDPAYPPRPAIPFASAIVNTGPDAWFVIDPATRQAVPSSEITSFTPHASPLGLVFDTDSSLADFTGSGFVLGYTNGRGLDLSSIRLQYNPTVDNYRMQVNRVAEGFNLPVDAALVGTTLYVLERGRQAISRVRFRRRVYPQADLSLAMTVQQRTPAVGEEVQFTVTVENQGPADAQSVVVDNRLPAGLVFSRSADFRQIPGSIQDTVQSLAAHTIRSLSYWARVARPGQYRNAAQILKAAVTDPDSEPDTGTADGEDDNATVDFRTYPDNGALYASDNPVAQPLPAVLPNQPLPDPARPDLSVHMALDKQVLERNQVLQVKMTIRNDGGAGAEAVQVRCQLPANVQFIPTPGWMLAGTELISDPVSLAPGQSLGRTVPLRAVAPGLLVIKATLTGPADADSTPNNGYENGEDDEAHVAGRVLP